MIIFQKDNLLKMTKKCSSYVITFHYLLCLIKVKEPTNRIVCNSAELKVDDIKIVIGEDGNNVSGIKTLKGVVDSIIRDGSIDYLL